jgi:hypothetical protein
MTNWQRQRHYARGSAILRRFSPHPPIPRRRLGSSGAPTIGRPLGAPQWIAALERQLGRHLAPGKPGPKPRMDGATKRQLPLL